MNPILFLLLAILSVAGALTVVIHRNPVHSALGLVVTLFLLAVMFVGLEAHLVAVLQVIVYAGAIVVLFLFVIMLLNQQGETRLTGGLPLVVAAVLGGAAFLGLIMAGFARAKPTTEAQVAADFGQTAALAERLFTAYLLPFELTSVLLLVAIVGAVALARRQDVP